MKKIAAVLIAMLLVIPSFVITASAGSSGIEPPKLIYEPVSAFVRTGDKIILSAVAQGKGLEFSWKLRTSEGGDSKIYDLSKSSDVKAFEDTDGKGKMKVTVKSEDLGDDQVRQQVIIDYIIYLNYGLGVLCTVSNSAGSKECDPASIFMSDNAPDQAQVELIAEFSARDNRLFKLFNEVTVPKGAGYNDDDIEYIWYQTPDGDKTKGVKLDYETYPILLADGYTSGPGKYYFFCQVVIWYDSFDYYYETGVTEMTVYEPKNIIEFDQSEFVIYDGESKDITVTARVEPEKDKGELTYQWYSGSSPDKIDTKLSGETSPKLTLTGGTTAADKYYTCVVNNHTDDDFDFDNAADAKPYVKVRFAGCKKLVITEHPKDAEVKDGEKATFTVKADNAVQYEWYIYDENDNTMVKVSDTPDMFAGADTPALTVTGSEELNGKNFLCSIADGANVFTYSSYAKLTVIKPEISEYPKITDTHEEITVHAGDEVKLTVQATVSDGGTLRYKWYTADVDPVIGGHLTVYTEITEAEGSAEYKPDTSKEGEFFYQCRVMNHVEGKDDNEPAAKVFKVTVLKAEDTSNAAGNDTKTDPSSGAVTTSGDGQQSKNQRGLVTALLIIIGVLAAALVTAGVLVLVRIGKKKNDKQQ